MPWFPECAYVLQLATSGRPSTGDDSAVRRFTETPEAARPELLAERFNRVAVDDPQNGRVEGPGLAEFGLRSAEWLKERDAHTTWVASTVIPGRAVGEWVAHLTESGREIALPVAVVAERREAREGEAESLELRIYYTQWPLLGRHTVRPPLLPDAGVQPQGWPGRYHDALAAGDSDAIVATFEPDGSFREPSGGEYVYRGYDALRGLYSLFFSAGGGIILEHAAVTDDGIRCALEYNAVRWGAHPMPPQAGIAVYERGPSGRLISARVYDDVEPPEFGSPE